MQVMSSGLNPIRQSSHLSVSEMKGTGTHHLYSSSSSLFLFSSSLLLSLIVIILHLQPLELETRALPLIQHRLVVHILDAGAHVVGARGHRSVGVLVLGGQETQAIEQWGRDGPHGRFGAGAAEIQEAQAWDVHLVLGRSDDAVDGGFDEA